MKDLSGCCGPGPFGAGVAVTGGTGFFGSRLVATLRARGIRVRALARASSDTRRIAALGAEIVHGDVTDPASLTPLFAGQALVIHAAGKVTDWGPREEFFRVNAQGTANVVAGCRAAGVRRLVHLGSLTVLGLPRDGRLVDERQAPEARTRDAYSASKLSAERVVRAAHGEGGLETVVVRCGVIWGPGEPTILPRIAALLRRGWMVYPGGGGNRVGLTHVDNLVAGVLLAASVPGAAGGVYHVTDGEEVTCRELIDALAGALGLPRPRRSGRRAPRRGQRRRPGGAGRVSGAAARIRIESLGVHLPETVVTTAELIGRCRHRPRVDLEGITGVRERRAAVGEHALDLAVRAAERALALSRYRAADLDALICTSISKHHRDDEFTLEPATAVLVRAAIGARRALVFDVVNACAGMLTGLAVLRALIGTGAVRAGMVVSGEQNLPLAWSATREIRHSLDRQLAALTLGDAGAALVVDAAPDARFGVRHLELVTGAKHDHYCRSLPSPRGPGGILLTKARGLQRKGAEHFPAYLKRSLDAAGWCLDDLDHVIPHQVSVRAIRRGVKELGRALGCEPPGVFRCCADRYGNTTTTSHFVALHDLMVRGEVRPGDNVLLVSGASGIVIAHAALTLDDLPERYRARYG